MKNTRTEKAVEFGRVETRIKEVKQRFMEGC